MGEEMKDKQTTRYTRIENRLKKLEKFAKDVTKYMKTWGPDVQKRRDERDAVWDEMVRVVSIQRKKNEKDG